MEEYSLLLNDFKNHNNHFKKELSKLIKHKCNTYGEVTIVLKKLRNNAVWNNDKFFIALLDQVEENFNREKDSLSVK